MTPRLEVLWHREIGDRLLVALEEEPRMKCPECYGAGFYEVIADPYVVGCVTCGGVARGPNGSGSIPMPSGTRVELVQEVADEGGHGWIPLGVATLEEVVPWLKVIPWPLGEDGTPDDSIITVDLEGTNAVWFPPDLYDDLESLSAKYVALCEVKKVSAAKPSRVLFHNLEPERKEMLEWLKKEFPYADGKFKDGLDKNLDDQQSFEDRIDWILNYAARAKQFDPSTPQGRQALAKLACACVRLTESSIRLYGPLPKGGLPSGELEGV